MRFAPWILGVVLTACASSQTQPTASASSSPPPNGAGSASTNPCGNGSTPARFPDGGVNPEACVGACSLIRAPGPVLVTDGGPAPPTGNIDLRSVDQALRREARSLRGCYDSAVIAHPWLGAQGGVVNVRFIIEPTGRVRGRPDATGIEQVPEVATCLANRVRYIVFPTPDGGPAEISVPFNFEGAT